MSRERKHTSGRKSAATKKALKSKKELLEIERRWCALHADATSPDKPLGTRVAPDVRQKFEQEQLSAVRRRLYRDLSTEETRKPTGIELLEERLKPSQQDTAPLERNVAARKIVTPSKKRDHEVSKRRTIAKNNRGFSAGELCRIFDREKVPLPDKWQVAGLQSWTEAYKGAYRSQIDVIIAKDKTNNS